jgi:hypothetical protein
MKNQSLRYANLTRPKANTANSWKHNDYYGDEKMLENLEEMGQLEEVKKKYATLGQEDLEKAAKM